MDNVIQNIKIEAIVPSNHQNTVDSLKGIEELAISIKNNGLKEPLILRKVNNRYEIISGAKKYKAAILVGLSTVPAIVKDYDSNNLLKYINKNDEQYPNSINNDSDVINLSELNKEYERDDFNMNNELMNNNNMLGQQNENQNATPTFGGRFFPSLEDEPTNMAFNTTIEPSAVAPQTTNSFIDLTDIGNNVPSQAMPEQMPNLNQEVQPTMPIQSDNVMPQNDGSIINLASLTQNNSMVEPMVQPVASSNIDNNFQEVINDFQSAPAQDMMTSTSPALESTPLVDTMPLNQSMMMPDQPINSQPLSNLNTMEPNMGVMPTMAPINNQFDVSQNMEQTPSVMDSTSITPVVDNLNIGQPIQLDPPINPIIEPAVTPIMDPPSIDQPIINQPEMTNQIPQKDVLPVINTLKAVGVNLENFGYTIRITDEDLPNSYKITIEVDK